MTVLMVAFYSMTLPQNKEVQNKNELFGTLFLSLPTCFTVGT